MKRLFNNTFISFFDHAVLIGLNLIATPILIDNFGIDGYGAFVFLNIFSIYGALALFDLGMEGALMNYIARFQASGETGKMHKALTVSLIYYAMIGVVVGLLIYVGSDLLASRLLDENSTVSLATVNTAITIVSVNVAIQFLIVPVTAALQGMRRYVITKGVNSVMNVGRYTLLIVVALLYQRIDIAYGVILVLTLVRLSGLTYILLKRIPDFSGWRPQLDLTLFKKLFSYSSILFVTRIIGLVHNQSPKIFIWYFLSVASMTVYDVVARPALLLRAIIGMLVSALIPEAARLHEQRDYKSLRLLYMNLVRYAYLILLPIMAVLFVHVDKLIAAWVGEQFESDAWLALILIAGFLVIPVSTVANTMVVGLEKVKETIWIPITGTILNVIVSLILLQYIGLPGLLLGTLVSQLFVIWPYARFMGSLLEFGIRDLMKPILPAFLIALVSSIVNAICVIQVGDSNMSIIAGVAGISVLINLAGNYRFLLSAEEKRFVADRIRAIRSKMVTAS